MAVFFLYYISLVVVVWTWNFFLRSSKASLSLRCFIRSCRRTARHAAFPGKGVFTRVCLQIQNDNLTSPDANGKNTLRERNVLELSGLMKTHLLKGKKEKKKLCCMSWCHVKHFGLSFWYLNALLRFLPGPACCLCKADTLQWCHATTAPFLL